MVLHSEYGQFFENKKVEKDRINSLSKGSSYISERVTPQLDLQPSVNLFKRDSKQEKSMVSLDSGGKNDSSGYFGSQKSFIEVHNAIDFHSKGSKSKPQQAISTQIPSRRVSCINSKAGDAPITTEIISDGVYSENGKRLSNIHRHKLLDSDPLSDLGYYSGLEFGNY